MKNQTEIYIASDHAGFKLKSKILESYFKDKPNIIVRDLGTYSVESVDYPLLAQKLCKKIKKDNFGILICGSGIGV